MTRRILVPLALIAACPAVGLAQGFSRPLPTPPPVRVPGTNLLYPAASPFTPPPLGMIRPGVVRPFARWGYNPWYEAGYYEPGVAYWYNYIPSPPMSVVRYAAPATPPPLQGAGGGPTLVDAEFPASYTVEFPADVKLFLNGKEVPGEGRTRVLTSPPLKVGATFTFDIRAEWAADGKRYEWDRSATLGPGERGRATVARGFLIKD
jgi:uncharacterized protein (TIGR03000 family)